MSKTSAVSKLNHEKYPINVWVGTNSGMDYWNGILDWTIGLSHFPF